MSLKFDFLERRLSDVEGNNPSVHPKCSKFVLSSDPFGPNSLSPLVLQIPHSGDFIAVLYYMSFISPGWFRNFGVLRFFSIVLKTSKRLRKVALY